MTEQSIIGSIRISDYDYPFAYQKETEKTTIHIGGKASTVPEDHGYYYKIKTLRPNIPF